MRFESKKLANELTSGSGEEFNCSSWIYKTIEVTGTGTVSIEGTIDGTTWNALLGGPLTGPTLVSMSETVASVRATWVSGTVDVWIAGMNS